MTTATHPPHEHFPWCTGPQNCSEYRSLLKMTTAQHCAWILKDRERIAAMRTAQGSAKRLRASNSEALVPPDPYAPQLAKRRAAEATPESRFADRYREQQRTALAAESTTREIPAPRVLSAAELQQFTPPNGYAIALAKMKENR